MHALIYLSIVLLAAIIASYFTGKLKVPVVTGFVIVGVLLGDSGLKIYSDVILNELELASYIALSIIGFTIGSELTVGLFKRLGRSILFIVFGEAFGAFIIVFLGIYFLKLADFPTSLVLAAISSATAPAATLAVIQQYKAKGPLTSTLLAVVSIDDAISLIIFVFASNIVKSYLSHEQMNIVSTIVVPLREIFLSILLGSVVGYIGGRLWKNVRSSDALMLRLGFMLMFTMGVAKQFDLSGFMSCMAMGVVVANYYPFFMHRSKETLRVVSSVFYAYFFILAGAHLDIRVFPLIKYLSLAYLLFRIMGKVGGASLGATLGNAPESVRKYVGFGLLPQVGVAIAMMMIVKDMFAIPKYGEEGTHLALIVINILLFTTIVTEVIGPLLTRYALTKSGERSE